MSFLKKLFGGSGQATDAASAKPTITETREHAGFTIKATPIPEGGQFRLAALIEKEIGGAVKSHRMIRADLFPSKDDATRFALRKAEQVIDEQGDAIFRD
ncbi:HlyU family transcriptional regulator [Jiella avicenniae]|uniref:HlyU family transcriptional regulator n=1 Tax=Jiella avicenniae TaxID=2907202 RepID=A0A9X1P1R7_9HYPH|nr:HlyU family transcriptional regulator [Jiella avicenniae]MCE7028189.1 HlyU family transcriptional regulator [Jiella avicenniae]